MISASMSIYSYSSSFLLILLFSSTGFSFLSNTEWYYLVDGSFSTNIDYLLLIVVNLDLTEPFLDEKTLLVDWLTMFFFASYIF
jgi:hypothetical protein